MARPGLENFFQVTDEIYRGAQPSEEGIRELKKLGVKTVINLGEFHSDADEIPDTGLKSIRIKFRTSDPEEEEIVRFLKPSRTRGTSPLSSTASTAPTARA